VEAGIEHTMFAATELVTKAAEEAPAIAGEWCEAFFWTHLGLLVDERRAKATEAHNAQVRAGKQPHAAKGEPMRIVRNKVVTTEMGAAPFFRMCLTLGQRYIEQAIAALEMQDQLAPHDAAAEHRYCSETTSRLLPTDLAAWLKAERSKVRTEFWGLLSAAKRAVEAHRRQREDGSQTPLLLDVELSALRMEVTNLPLSAAHPELNMLVVKWYERAERQGRLPGVCDAYNECARELFEMLGGGRK
jgi:hypothetical protein